MKIEYGRTADALYVYFKEKEVSKSKEVEKGVIIDLDENKHIIGIGILDANKRFSLQELANVNIENIPLEGTPLELVHQ